MAAFEAIVLAGDGLNSERETAAACRDGGFAARIVHVSDFTAEAPKFLSRAKLFVIPGGFSFGDEIGSGVLLALKLRHQAGSALDSFLNDGGAMLGVCNGFQTLARLGLFDSAFGGQVALAHNESGRFVNQWAKLNVTGSSIFTTSLTGKSLTLPVRHGEGRFTPMNIEAAEKARANGSVVLTYDTPVNGAWGNVAGVSSHDGRVLGLMPHPEAFWNRDLAPQLSEAALGTEFFRNAYFNFKGGRS